MWWNSAKKTTVSSMKPASTIIAFCAHGWNRWVVGYSTTTLLPQLTFWSAIFAMHTIGQLQHPQCSPDICDFISEDKKPTEWKIISKFGVHVIITWNATNEHRVLTENDFQGCKCVVAEGDNIFSVKFLIFYNRKTCILFDHTSYT